MQYLVDSNILIASLRASEDDHAKAVGFLENLSDFVITDYILSEVATVIRLKENLILAAKTIHLLTQNAQIHLLRLTDEELVETAAFFLTQKKEISFVDASLIIAAKNHNLTLATLDKNLAKAAQGLL